MSRQLRGVAADRPGEVQCLDSQLLAEQGPGPAAHQGHPVLSGDDRRFAFQAVHMIADGDFIGPWKEGDPRQSKIVFIGRDLNRPQLRRGFEACQVMTRPRSPPRSSAGARYERNRGYAEAASCSPPAAASGAGRLGGRPRASRDGAAAPSAWATARCGWPSRERRRRLAERGAAHDGACLVSAPDAGDGFLTGGDDGRLVRIGAGRHGNEIAGSAHEMGGACRRA